jgi:hypothetical protein
MPPLHLAIFLQAAVDARSAPVDAFSYYPAENHLLLDFLIYAIEFIFDFL